MELPVRFFFVRPSEGVGGVWVRPEDRSNVWGFVAAIPTSWRVPRRGIVFLVESVQ